MAGAVTDLGAGQWRGRVVRTVLVSLTVAVIVTALRSSVAVEWLADGRPWWAHLGRSVLKWAWVTFVLVRAVETIRDWFEGRPRLSCRTGFEALNRVAVTCAPGLPRFVLYDPMGGSAFCLWYGAILVTTDGFLQMHPSYGPKARQAFWTVAFVLLIPWGLPFVPTQWPGQMT